MLLFGSAFAAYATAAAMVGSSVPLVTLQIADALSGNVLVGQENVALALSLDMIVVAGLVMAVYLPLQRRSARWLPDPTCSPRPAPAPGARPRPPVGAARSSWSPALLPVPLALVRFTVDVPGQGVTFDAYARDLRRRRLRRQPAALAGAGRRHHRASSCC